MNRPLRPSCLQTAGVLCLIIAAGVMPGGAGAQTPPPGVAYSAGFVPASRAIFDLNLAGEVIGEFPKSIKLLQGSADLVLKDGAKMLKANSGAEFLIALPEYLPPDFTVEFALVPKLCCTGPDFSFEGARTINQDVASAHLLWHAGGELSVVGGAADNYATPMPEDFKTTLPGVLTKVNVSFEGSTVKLYTNGRRLYTVDRKFARGRVLRVFLGGSDGPEGAVYLAGLRIASNSSPVTGFSNAPAGFVPASRVLYDLNAPPPPPPPPGTPPKPQPGIRVQKGAWTRVTKDGRRMFRAAAHTELLVSLLERLPRDFTVELELVPKETGGPPPDLTLEGTAAIDQGPASAHLLWQAGGFLAVIGGAPDNYESPMPDDFKVTMPGAPTQIALSFEGNTIKLYTNGRRLYTLSRSFVRAKLLRVTLGAENATEQAVYLAALRIATNAPPPPTP